MKYIVTKQRDGTEEIFIFPRKINHDDMAEEIENIKKSSGFRDWERVHRQPISAGFINPNGECTGKSESLGLNPERKILS